MPTAGPKGCVAPVALVAAPAAAIICLAVGVAYAAAGVKQRSSYLVPWLFVLVTVQWLVSGGIVALALLD